MKAKNKGLCFVIMSFGDESYLNTSYQLAVKPVVEEMGYTCERTDEQQFNGRISQQIIKNIEDAEFIIADVTQARPNCYYELGYAHALGKTVIHISRNKEDIHFDASDYNFIVYNDDAVALKEKLKLRLEGTEKSLAYRVLHIIQSADQNISVQRDVMSELPIVKARSVILAECHDLRALVADSQCVLFSYANGENAQKSVASVLNAVADYSIPLVTYCAPDPMPNESYALLTAHKPLGLVAQMASSLESALKKAIKLGSH